MSSSSPRRKFIPDKGEEKKNMNKASTSSSSQNELRVNPKQKANPVLQHLPPTCPWSILSVGSERSGFVTCDKLPDFALGNIFIWFISLRYHRLHPDYIYDRLMASGVSLSSNDELLEQEFTHGKLSPNSVRVLLVQVDVEDDRAWVRELSKLCVSVGLSMILAFSDEEAAKTLVLYRNLMNRGIPSTSARQHEKLDINEQSPYNSDAFIDNLHVILKKSLKIRLSRRDIQNLLLHYGSFSGVIKALDEGLGECVGGIGEKKGLRLSLALSAKFKADKSPTISQTIPDPLKEEEDEIEEVDDF